MLRSMSKIVAIHVFSYSIAYAAHFNTGSATPTQALIDELNKACEQVDNGSSIIVEGHTDTRGGNEYNLRLSKDRAESVKMFLLEKCQNKPKEIRTVGFGKMYPVSDKHEDNRRVVLHIYGEKIKTIYIAESGTKQEEAKAVAVSVPKEEPKPREEHVKVNKERHYLSLIGTVGSAAHISAQSNNDSARVVLTRGMDMGVLYQYKPEDSPLFLGVGGTFFYPMLMFSMGLELE